jgi:hypothetical protein
LALNIRIRIIFFDAKRTAIRVRKMLCQRALNRDGN